MRFHVIEQMTELCLEVIETPEIMTALVAVHVVLALAARRQTFPAVTAFRTIGLIFSVVMQGLSFK
ncbi:hypothetical protein A8U91_01993 [Halomonas elongata]|uniref:Uncharacterized protein n=1 Tax=Halomonas elongata TaxID=2746 RepID=A0A1B8P5V2_HALEL|nr:hypothetical protein [Halomonas elongata]OBX37618.1 hypothetical protein A8U91_01993 [Halomonas elongata]